MLKSSYILLLLSSVSAVICMNSGDNPRLDATNLNLGNKSVYETVNSEPSLSYAYLVINDKVYPLACMQVFPSAVMSGIGWQVFCPTRVWWRP